MQSHSVNGLPRSEKSWERFNLDKFHHTIWADCILLMGWTKYSWLIGSGVSFRSQASLAVTNTLAWPNYPQSKFTHNGYYTGWRAFSYYYLSRPFLLRALRSILLTSYSSNNTCLLSGSPSHQCPRLCPLIKALKWTETPQECQQTRGFMVTGAFD